MNDRSRSIARVQFLGTQRVEIGSDVVTPEAERLFAMIVRLSVPLGRITSRQTMMDTLWPGAGDANARHNLRQTVYKAREIGLVVESGEDGLRLDPRHWSCDWEDPIGDVDGEWLPEYVPDFSDELATWITAQRVGVHALIRPRIIRSLQTARSSGELVIADRYAVQLLKIDELNEEATLTRAELLAIQGAKVDALKLLDAYLLEIGRVGSGRDAALPAQLLRRRIAEKLPAVSYHSGTRHHGPLVGRQRESKRLVAGLFDARAGRGSAFLVHGGDGTGKSRLMFEAKKSAVLQGMLVLEHQCDSTPSAMPFASLRSLVSRLLEYPGAMGIAPEALGAIRTWLTSNEFAPDDCPLMEIEDLLASVSEETPLLVLVEHAERMDGETLGRLDRIYRKGVRRHHVMVLTSATYSTPTVGSVDTQWIERVALHPMTTTEVRAVVAAYAGSEQPRATQDQIACAAVFAEGIPMFGIEMLGLMLDSGSPDVIPWRVQIGIDRSLRELSEIHWRILALCGALAASSRQAVVAAAMQIDAAELAAAIDALETAGSLRCEDGVLRVSSLMAEGAEKRMKANVMRLDALRAATEIQRAADDVLAPDDFYSCLRLFVVANEETRARDLLDSRAGVLVRIDTANSIVFELTRLRRHAISTRLMSLIDQTIDQIRGGSESRRPGRRKPHVWTKPTSLPLVSATSIEIEYTLSSSETLATVLSESRDPNSTPERRLSEAVMALFVASNLGDSIALREAHRAVNAVRYSVDASPFDLCRADLIYFASMGIRDQALECARKLCIESRIVRDVQLACKGFRNAAEVFSTFGDSKTAQALLHESRSLAASLEYHSQVAWADIRLADLCIEAMDIEGASAYLQCATNVVEANSLLAPLLVGDLNLHRCWEALLRGDISRAQRSSRVVARKMNSSRCGTALWTVQSVRLATHRGNDSREMSRDFASLRASVGSRAFYPNEQLSLAALILYANGRRERSEVTNFVADQFSRIEASGRQIWSYLREIAVHS